MRQATLFLLKKNNKILLAMKKKGFGMGKWNGVGGKVREREEIEKAALREAKEEIGVDIKDFQKIAVLDFTFKHNPYFDQRVHVFLTDSWQGEPEESEEMRPKWFDMKEIPYSKMWDDDKYWLPLVLDGKLVKAEFSFDKNDIIDKYNIKTVNEII